MALEVRHRFVSTVPDGPDPLDVQTQRDWNDTHEVTGLDPLELLNYLAVGADPAQSGAVRLMLGEAISWRNEADDGDVAGVLFRADPDERSVLELGGGTAGEVWLFPINPDDDGEPLMVVSGEENQIGIFSGNDLTIFDASYNAVRGGTQGPNQRKLTIGSDLVRLGHGLATSGSPVQTSGRFAFDAAFYSDPLDLTVTTTAELRLTQADEMTTNWAFRISGELFDDQVNLDGFMRIFPQTSYSGSLGKPTALWGALYAGGLHVPAAASVVAATANLTVFYDTYGTFGGVTISLGNKLYTFVEDGDFDADGEIPQGPDAATMHANIVAAINGTDGINTPNAYATLAAFVGNTAAATAIEPGLAGNHVRLATNALSGGWDQSALTGGLEAKGVFLVGQPTVDPANGLSQVYLKDFASLAPGDMVLAMGT